MRAQLTLEAGMRVWRQVWLRHSYFWGVVPQPWALCLVSSLMKQVITVWGEQKLKVDC